MPEIKNQITLGNLIQIGSMLVVVALAWGTISNSQAAHSRSISDHEERLRMLEKSIPASLARIETKLERMEAGR